LTDDGTLFSIAGLLTVFGAGIGVGVIARTVRAYLTQRKAD